MKSYEINWAGRINTPENYRILSGASEAIRGARWKSDILKSRNGYLVTCAIMSVDVVGTPIDISAIAAYTGLQRSSIYNTLRSMKTEKLIIFYTSDSNKNSKYIKPSKILTHQYLAYLDELKDLIDLTAKKLQ